MHFPLETHGSPFQPTRLQLHPVLLKSNGFATGLHGKLIEKIVITDRKTFSLDLFFFFFFEQEFRFNLKQWFIFTNWLKVLANPREWENIDKLYYILNNRYGENRISVLFYLLLKETRARPEPVMFSGLLVTEQLCSICNRKALSKI